MTMNPRTPGDLDIAALEAGHSHLIEANAGTGKTYAIANLFLRFVLEGHAVGDVLVVTFTNAARDELRERLRQRLAQAVALFRQGQCDEGEDGFFRNLRCRYDAEEARQRLEVALLDMDQAVIHTIHGFCQQALSDHAVASGQPFDLEQIDDTDLKLHMMRDWWRTRTYNLAADELRDFGSVFRDFGELRETLAPLLACPAPDLDRPVQADVDAWQAVLDQDLDTLARHWRDERDRIEQLLVSSPILNRQKHRKNTMQGVFAALDRHLSVEPPTPPEPGLLAAIDRSRFVFKNNTEAQQADFDLETFRLAQSRGDAIQANLQRLHHARKALLLLEARDFVLSGMEAIKQEHGWLAFDDMIRGLHAALCEKPSGNTFARRLARRFPVILIDEFQDTDPLQYGIFRQIHEANAEDGGQHTLIMIGDPKQAIYGFRGGDIFTYMQACRQADHHWTLRTNWRSTREMIEAVNHVFGGHMAFTYKDIPYYPSEAPETPRARPLWRKGRQQSALVIEPLPRDAGNKSRILEKAHEITACRIAELLADETADIDGRRPEPGDIAVLVREKSEAVALQACLKRRGVNAVTLADTSVWDTDEAVSMTDFVQAMTMPDDRQAARQAIATPVLGLDLEELYRLQNTPSLWSRWVELLHELHDVWDKAGFMAAWHGLMRGVCEILVALRGENSAGPVSTWLQYSDQPERMLTNLNHLAELIQQAGHDHHGMEAVLGWMIEQKAAGRRDEYQLRLENDDKRVRIMTLHISKGLQFPVVFLPYLWHCRPQGDKGVVQWHEADDAGRYRHRYTPCVEAEPQARLLAEHERLAEDIRLAYVALTRAESHCHLLFGPLDIRDARWKGHPGRTALAWLLSPDRRRIDLDEEGFSVAPDEIDPGMVAAGSGHIDLIPAMTEVPVTGGRPPPEEPACEVAHFTRAAFRNWRVQSFSAMTRGIHQATQAERGEAERYSLRFPAGAGPGSFLHALLEHLDFRHPVEAQLRPLATYYARRHDIQAFDADRDLEALSGWLRDILATPLDDTGLTLDRLDPGRQVRELEFDFSTSRIHHETLQECLVEYAQDDLPRVAFQAFEGLVTGAVDLVFEHGGRYYIADYKSNLLGRHPDDYSVDHLRAEILRRRYDLQYLLYTLALHRHLSRRIPGYDYDRHFGGVYYLFLRAMTPDSGRSRGIYFDRPPRSLVEHLDLDIFTMPGTETT